MQWIEAKVIFKFCEKQAAVELISDVFYELGVKGVVVEDPDVDFTDAWWDESVKMPEEDAVIGYFPKNEHTEKQCEKLKTALMQIKSENNIDARIILHEIDEEDWAESWKAYFFPQKISKNIVIKPTWQEYHPNPNDMIIEIDPGMAFGTGTHPTTVLCVNMVETYLMPGNDFLDVGTGSGILMIAAGKLGAKKLWGVDADPVAVEVARKNLLLNQIPPEMFRVINGNLADGISEKFDLITANILSEVILILLDNIKNVLKKNGIFICSGIIEENKEPVIQKMKAMNFNILDVLTEQKWVSITAQI